MDNFAIYTYGGSELLISIFNAVGMIFKSNNTYLTPVGTMAMGLGGLYASVKMLFNVEFSLFSRGWLIPSMVTFLLLFSPKSTVWIHDDVALNAPVKVDNIPIGIALFTSMGTSISHHLSKLLEETMLPPDMPGATHTGLLYGAKTVAKLRDAQIQDPVLLRNVKEYMRQCYMKPYVMGDFAGLKGEAVRATDILAFLQQYPAKCWLYDNLR